MIFWDSSALAALLINEQDSTTRFAQLQADPLISVWWATSVEIESALQRRLRENSITKEQAKLARDRLRELELSWHEVSPVAQVKTTAVRLLRTHPLRAADSLQLAAAINLKQAGITNLIFACADVRLLQAAEIEGFVCI